MCSENESQRNPISPIRATRPLSWLRNPPPDIGSKLAEYMAPTCATLIPAIALRSRDPAQTADLVALLGGSYGEPNRRGVLAPLQQAFRLLGHVPSLTASGAWLKRLADRLMRPVRARERSPSRKKMAAPSGIAETGRPGFA